MKININEIKSRRATGPLTIRNFVFFDAQKLNHTSGGDPLKKKRIVQEVIDELPRLVELLEWTVSDNDTVQVARLLNEVKAAICMVSAEKLLTFAHRMELRSRRVTVSAYRAEMAELLSALNVLHEESTLAFTVLSKQADNKSLLSSASARNSRWTVCAVFRQFL